MKIIKYFFFLALGTLLMAADCSNKDSEFYNDVFATTPGLIALETQSAYSVNDILWINSNNFSRNIQEANQTHPLDVFETTGGAQSFNFSYLLEKKVSADVWTEFPLGNDLIPDKGIAEETELFIAASCIYNPVTAAYEFRYGLKLSQPGQYRLSFGYNSTNATSVELRSDSVGNNLFLNINSLVSGLDGSGYYNFNVSE